jgi:hypothetical protein
MISSKGNTKQKWLLHFILGIYSTFIRSESIQIVSFLTITNRQFSLMQKLYEDEIRFLELLRKIFKSSLNLKGPKNNEKSSEDKNYLNGIRL